MRRMRTHAHENREPATTRWVRAAGADIARCGAARPLWCQHSVCFRSRRLNLEIALCPRPEESHNCTDMRSVVSRKTFVANTTYFEVEAPVPIVGWRSFHQSSHRALSEPRLEPVTSMSAEAA
jgi:hypothetical protein